MSSRFQNKKIKKVLSDHVSALYILSTGEVSPRDVKESRYARVLQFLLWWYKICGASTPLLIKFHLLFLCCWEFTLHPSALLETRLKRVESRDLRFISTSKVWGVASLLALPPIAITLISKYDGLIYCPCLSMQNVNDWFWEVEVCCGFGRDVPHV